MTKIVRVVVPTPQERPTLPIWPDTGQLLGLCKASTYAAAASGEIPTIRVGRRLLVPTAALRRMLQMDDDRADSDSVRADHTRGGLPAA